MTWIKPDNYNLAVVTGSFGGLGLNPIPSFDMNVIGTGGFIAPFYNTLESYIGMVLALLHIRCILLELQMDGISSNQFKSSFTNEETISCYCGCEF